MSKPKVAVYKFSSCAGCQLQLINFENDLLDILNGVEFVYFKEATRREDPPPYDIGLIEGAVTCHHEEEKIKKAREDCKVLIALGACACEGCCFTMKNDHPIEEQVKRVYTHPEWIDTFDKAYGIDHFVKVDGYVHGCPVDRKELQEFIVATLIGKTPFMRPHAVCVECKLKGNECLVITENALCLGSITRGGCGAVCPSNGTPCFGCRGPNADPYPEALVDIFLKRGHDREEVQKRFMYFSGATAAFQKGRDYVNAP